jgi:thiamine-monophosphate kinase
VSSEHERIAMITQRLREGGERAGVQVDLGDDAAIVRGASKDVVLSVDAAVEGVHFDRSLLSHQDIGFRAVSAALSDLAAMGARPRCALTAFTCPPDLDDARLLAIVEGITEAQAYYECPVVGGNLSRAQTFSS